MHSKYNNNKSISPQIDFLLKMNTLFFLFFLHGKLLGRGNRNNITGTPSKSFIDKYKPD